MTSSFERRWNLRIPRAIRTASMLATLTSLISRSEKLLTLTASSADSLTGLLMDEILASGFRRPAENNLLLRQIPVGNDRGVLRTLLKNRSSLLAALFLLGLGALRRDTWALLAPSMFALGALFSKPERCVAEMALPVDTHTNWLLNTKSMSFGFMPLAGLQFQSVKLSELLRTFFEDLGSRDLRGSRILGDGRNDRRRGGGWSAILCNVSITSQC